MVEEAQESEMSLLKGVTGLGEQSHNTASGGPVVDDGAQDGDLDAV
jgi:hypothetical protein